MQKRSILSLKSRAQFFHPEFREEIEIKWKMLNAKELCARIQKSIEKSRGTSLEPRSDYGRAAYSTRIRNAISCYKAGRLSGKAHSKSREAKPPMRSCLTGLSSRLQSLFKFLKVNLAAEVAINSVKLPVSHLQPYPCKGRIK